MPAHPILDPTAPFNLLSGMCAHGIMTKAPEPGKVKTRLTPPLTPEEAARLNKCFLFDLGESIAHASAQSTARGVGVFTPVGAEGVFSGILPDTFYLIPQRGTDFGERLIFAAEDLFKVGFQSVCLINSDSPTVPTSSFVEAANVLARPGDRVVLGPSDDGGYYLIGLTQMQRRLFEEIDWSTERVLSQTLERAKELGLEVHLLPNGFDVDDGATLHRLCLELLGKEAPPETAPKTRMFLEEIIKSEGRDRICPAL